MSFSFTLKMEHKSPSIKLPQTYLFDHVVPPSVLPYMVMSHYVSNMS